MAEGGLQPRLVSWLPAQRPRVCWTRNSRLVRRYESGCVRATGAVSAAVRAAGQCGALIRGQPTPCGPWAPCGGAWATDEKAGRPPKVAHWAPRISVPPLRPVPASRFALRTRSLWDCTALATPSSTASVYVATSSQPRAFSSFNRGRFNRANLVRANN